MPARQPLDSYPATVHPDKDRNDDPENPYGGRRLDGLYWDGPRGMYCVLAQLIANSLLLVSGSTTQGMRQAKNAERAQTALRRALAWQRGDADTPPCDPDDPDASFYRAVLIVHHERDDRERRRTTKLGRYHIASGKRPNSGRKRRAA